MSDPYKIKNYLSLVAEFTDGDDRTINLDNPKSTLNASLINACNSSASGILVGDREGADFVRFKSARAIKTTTVYLDLTED